MQGQSLRQRHGVTKKTGCKFYLAFTEITPQSGTYRCSGIGAVHGCERDPNTLERYAQHRNKDPRIPDVASRLMRNQVVGGQAANIINDELKTCVTSRDVHRVMQTIKEKSLSLSDVGVPLSESQRLLNEITKNNDQYRVKYKDNTQIMECIFYWDPNDVALARRCCQV